MSGFWKAFLRVLLPHKGARVHPHAAQAVVRADPGTRRATRIRKSRRTNGK
jgi:hypothetical protein